MLTAAWESYIAGFHRQRPGITERALEHSRHRLWGSGYDWLAAALPASTATVLDLACGSAPLQPRLPQAVYVGVDRSEEELRVARAKGRVTVFAGDVTALAIPDHSVDAVVMSMAFMLVPQPSVLAEVYRVLRAGGTFAALVPAVAPIRASDLVAVAALFPSLGTPGRMPQRVNTRRLARQLLAAGLTPGDYARRRFPFPVRGAVDARLAVESLYTPGVEEGRLRRGVERLTRLVPLELPVPLLRFTAHKPLRS